MRKQSPKNILMSDGTARRVPADEADELLASNKAKRFISNTVYRALKLGIEVKDPGTQDPKGALKKLIDAARESEKTKQQKAAKKKKERQKELAAMADAQEVLDDD